MQKVLLYAARQSRVLYNGTGLEKAREIANGIKGRVTLRIYTLIDSESGRMKLVTEEYIDGRSISTKISHLEDEVIINEIFKPKETSSKADNSSA